MPPDQRQATTMAACVQPQVLLKQQQQRQPQQMRPIEHCDIVPRDWVVPRVPPQPNVTDEYERGLVDASAAPRITKDRAVSLLAEELYRLSVTERNEILHEVHGVVDAVPEDDSAMVNYSLYELQKRLEGIAHKPAYDLACQLDYNYVTNGAFRLMFLRAHKFDAKAAAEHMVVHFSEKQKLFGNHLLAKDITYYDLNDQDIMALKRGRNVFFPRRDCAGRPVLGVRFLELSDEEYANGFLNNMMRASWYFVCDLARRDEQAQRLGIVSIAQNMRPCHPEGFAVIQEMARRRRGWPINLAATHYCGAYTPEFADSIPQMQLLLEKNVRKRFRTHFGDNSVIDQELKGYGIPFQALPLTTNTESALVQRAEEAQAKLQNMHQQFDGIFTTNGNTNARFPTPIEYSEDMMTSDLNQQAPVKIEIEEIEMDTEEHYNHPDTMSTASDVATIQPFHASSTAQHEEVVIIERPTEFCVLFGRGSLRDHPGNIRMHQIVNSRLDDYEKARKLEKTAMSAAVVRDVQASGGKFLKHQDGSAYWIETSDDDSREKVGKIFRRAVQLRRKAREEMAVDG